MNAFFKTQHGFDSTIKSDTFTPLNTIYTMKISFAKQNKKYL